MNGDESAGEGSRVVALGLQSATMDAFRAAAQEGQVLARVSQDHRGIHHVLDETAERACTLSGRLRHDVEQGRAQHPVVGDWVIITPQDEAHGVITAVLPRTTALWRRMAGSEERAQVLLANVDTACVVSSLDADINPRRVERFLALIMEGGIRPVVVLTKADLVADPGDALDAIRAVAPAVPVHAVSAFTGQGLAELEADLFGVPASVALIGSSGVGKSTLFNRWMGADVMHTSATLEDGRGRHTTTHRQLMLRPGGGVLMDTPGVREVGMAFAEDGIRDVFADVDALAQQCRFPDCTHAHEPGCAVMDAVARGDVDAARLEAWQRLQRENRWLQSRDDPRARMEQKGRDRTLGKLIKAHQKLHRR